MVATARKLRGAQAALPRISLLTLAALFLAVLATPVRAEERMLTLAMVNYESLLSPRIPLFKESVPATVHTFDMQTGSVAAPSEPAFEEAMSIPATLFMGDKTQPDPAGSIVLLRQTLPEKSFLKMLQRFEAGYGQVFYDKTVEIYGRNGTGWEEPGYGYLKVSFRF